jgi:HAD superfamily hydrolase (TIGR01509 family)
MDGTLVDTEPYWLAAEEELIAAWGGVWTREDGLQLVGSGLERSALIFQSRGVDLSVDEIISTLTDRVMAQISDHVPWRPGVLELLLELKQAGVPTAVVTMSVRRMAEHVVNSIGFDAFDTIVSGDEVDEPKPHPLPYLTAATRLGVDPRHCVAIEDSEPGVASAVAAGATTIAVPLHIPLPPSPAYALWPGLDGVTLADLARVHASEVRS